MSEVPMYTTQPECHHQSTRLGQSEALTDTSSSEPEPFSSSSSSSEAFASSLSSSSEDSCAQGKGGRVSEWDDRHTGPGVRRLRRG